MGRLWIVVLAAAALSMVGSAAYAGSSSLHPPATVMRQLDGLRRLDRVEALPLAIRSGDFEGARGYEGWAFAEPGGAWNETDVIVDSTLPHRRLIFAACNDELCLVHYELGGRGHSFHIVAVEKCEDHWKTLWNAYGFRPVHNLGELRALLRNQSDLYYDDTCSSCAS